MKAPRRRPRFVKGWLAPTRRIDGARDVLLLSPVQVNTNAVAWALEYTVNGCAGFLLEGPELRPMVWTTAAEWSKAVRS